MFSAADSIKGQNFALLFGIAIGIIAVVVIIIIVVRFLKKDNSLAAVERNLKSQNFSKALSLALHQHEERSGGGYILKKYIADAYYGLNDYEQAIKFYEAASVSAANEGQVNINIQILLKIAKLYKKVRKPREAHGYFVMVLEKQPRHSVALFEASEVLFESRNYKKAKEYMMTLNKIRPDNLRAKFLLARIHYHLGEYPDAARLLKVLISKLPDKDAMKNRAIFLYADVLFRSNKLDDSIKMLKPLLDVKEYFEKALIKMVDILVKAQKFQLAIDLANKNMNRIEKKKKIQILYQIASAYFKYGEIFQAIKLWEEAYKIDPNYLDLRDVMDRYNIILKNPELKDIYTGNDSNFEVHAMKLIRVKMVNSIIKDENFWIFKSGDGGYVVYKKPFPISNKDFDNINRHIKNEFLSNVYFTVYTLFGISKDAHNHQLYRRIKEVSGQKIIDLLKQG